MSIKTTTGETAVYGTGHLTEEKSSDADWPPSYHGIVQCESGMASAVITYMRRRPGRFIQLIYAETIIEGRVHTLHQQRTKCDRLTKDGAKRVILRWLRDLNS